MKDTSLTTSMITSFKDRVESDINTVFTNINTFGETVEINGKPVSVTIDEDALKERNLALVKQGKIHVDDKLFYCNRDVFGKAIPKAEALMNFSGINYRITSVKDDMGMLTITLRRYSGRR